MTNERLGEKSSFQNTSAAHDLSQVGPQEIWIEALSLEAKDLVQSENLGIPNDAKSTPSMHISIHAGYGSTAGSPINFKEVTFPWFLRSLRHWET